MFVNEELLWDYADGLLADDQRVQVEAWLLQHPEGQQLVEQIRAEKRALFEVPLEKPNGGFADRVMAAWAMEQVHAQGAKAVTRHKDWVIYGIAGVFGLFILTPIVALIVTLIQTQFEAPALPVDYTMPTVNWELVFGNSAFHYAAYLMLTFLLLRFAEKFIQLKMSSRPAHA